MRSVRKAREAFILKFISVCNREAAEKTENRGVVVIPIIIVALAIGAISWVRRESDHADIRRWAARQGYQIDGIEKTWFDKGPYWVKGERRIYRCRVRDSQGRSRLVYMRTRFFGNDYEFYDS